MRTPAHAPSDRLGIVLVIAYLVLLSGCTQEVLETKYGRSRGSGARSVNGTSVLRDMFEAEDKPVSTWQRLSPDIRRNRTIVWFLTDFSVPTDQQMKFLESWLQLDGRHRLILVGRDYDAAVDYWRKVAVDAPADQQLELVRRRSEAQAEHEYFRGEMAPKETPWYTQSPSGPLNRTAQLEGPWATDLKAADVYLRGTWLAKADAGARISASDFPYEVEVKLTVAGTPMVTELSFPNAGKIVLIANGSFLLNLPLVNHDHRRLAHRLIDSCLGDVAFLEGSPNEIRVYDQEPVQPNRSFFSAFTVWPLGAITFHFALLGILYCFNVFPIFGRPRQLAPEPLSDFGKHVTALGELLRRSGDQGYAQERLDDYQVRARRESGQSHLEKPMGHPPAQATLAEAPRPNPESDSKTIEDRASE